jgi:hypothetical protein
MELIRFVALAHPERMEEFGFTTLGEFAKRFKVNPGTLSEWLKEPEIQQEIKATWKRWGKQRTPNVIMALYKKAITEGNAIDVLAWMKIIEDWSEKTSLVDITVGGGDKSLGEKLRELPRDKARHIISIITEATKTIEANSHSILSE